MLCNWCSSEQLCKQWSNMCEEGFIWKNIELVWTDVKEDIEKNKYFNENEIYPDVSGMEQIKQINEKYKNQRIRVTGYGLDEKEAVTLVMQVLEQIDESILIEDISTISDKEKRYVLVEVLNEI